MNPADTAPQVPRSTSADLRNILNPQEQPGHNDFLPNFIFPATSTYGYEAAPPPQLHAPAPHAPLKLRLPPMPHPTHVPAAYAHPDDGLRRSSRHRTSSIGTAKSGPSGSEYNGESNESMHIDEEEDEGGAHSRRNGRAARNQTHTPVEEPVAYSRSSRGRKVALKSYVESDVEDFLPEVDGGGPLANGKIRRTTRAQNGAAAGKGSSNGSEHSSARPTRSRTTRRGPVMSDDDDHDDHGAPSNGLRRSMRARRPATQVLSEEEDTAPRGTGRYSTRSRSKKGGSSPTAEDEYEHEHEGGNGANGNGAVEDDDDELPPRRPTRITRGSRPSKRRVRAARDDHDEDGYVDVPSEPSAGELSFDNVAHTPPDSGADAEGDDDGEGEIEVDGSDGNGAIEVDGEETAGYALRKRTTRINYAIPPPLEEMKAPPKKPSGGRKGGAHGAKSKGLGWSASGAELGRWMGDDSDSDYAQPKQNALGATGVAFAGGAAGSALLPGDIAGGPSNMGKVGDAALADADPLGVNQNVTFDEVGGLDDHINSLKEMTLLPLLYPEVFQRFNLTPPRGVLFHGPPGTGKTLLARALAASCRSNGKGISFFMRKGADCLSKWVGEAERQLRLLFDEAKRCQPAIIFFDEIDGLAPVRSSKQDQVHASIVSTLLALMDGMDGRGQVVVIGATNRPDAVDPALRRPGRFDREFYFPLPNIVARERIIRIMTGKWEGWEGERGEEQARGLSKMTKGYGGADLRALCTEAALNAVQRRYPQIYKSTDRLLLKPETIGVELRDFMIAVKKLVPSSARSTASTASPLPAQLVPLLSDALNRVKEVVDRVMPMGKKRTALEEAEWEEEREGDALEREMMLQSMETLRVYRPRVMLHGPVGMGQGYVGAAALHHLEGYHVQSLELGNLMNDSTRTVEAAIVQLFMEAKRNQPSVIYIPSLVGWCAAVTETARATVRAMLDTLAPTDPVLLLAIVDGAPASLPRDVRSWFGITRENRVAFTNPSPSQRAAFFDTMIVDARRPPNLFPDGVKRKRRVLEELPVAPPLEPKMPTAAELAVQEENDQRTITLLKYRLGPVLTELKRKFKRFTKRAAEEYALTDADMQDVAAPVAETMPAVLEAPIVTDGVTEGGDPIVQLPHVNGDVNGIASGSQQVQAQFIPSPKLYNMDLEKMHTELYRGKYLTPNDFLDDLRKIVHNAGVRVYEDQDRLYKANAMLTAAEVSMHEMDPQLRMECDRMADRERQRRADRKKEREGAKASSPQANGGADGVYAPGTRRSTRNNGQHLDLEITDPLLLERRLKRSRSNEAGTDSHGSGGEEGIAGRALKRSRLSSEEDPAGPQSPHSVRFAEDGLAEASTPHANGVPLPEVGVHDRPSGFDPALLNPFTPVASTQPTQLVSDYNSLPPASPSVVESSASQSNGFDAALALASLATAAAQQVPMVVEETTVSAPELIVDPAPAPPSVDAMEVEREPTPMPEFHLDEDLLNALKTDLVERTATLNVEELEQLRATCLASVWRHRVDWDRDGLLGELRDIVRELVSEVDGDDVSASP